MKCIKAYKSPAILRQVSFAPQTALLAGSVVDTMSVTAVGQEIDETDFTGTGFNHDWQ